MKRLLVKKLDGPRVVGVALLASFSILGCGGGGPTESDTTPVATILGLSASAVALPSVGATKQLTATVIDQNGDRMVDASVAWVSSSTSVANVTSTGLVEAVADGTATITATSGSAVGTASVSVQTGFDPLVISNLTLRDGQVGTNYSTAMEATGGNGSYEWTFVSGQQPEGLIFVASDDQTLLTGLPGLDGSKTFTVMVQSNDGQEATKEFSVSISAATSFVVTGWATTSSVEFNHESGGYECPYRVSVRASGGQAGDYVDWEEGFEHPAGVFIWTRRTDGDQRAITLTPEELASIFGQSRLLSIRTIAWWDVPFGLELRVTLLTGIFSSIGDFVEIVTDIPFPCF
jgi:hypothetical protein